MMMTTYNLVLAIHISSKFKKIIFLMAVILCLKTSYLYAYVGMEGSGVGARALAMGGGFIGFADDLSAVWWNPAGISQRDKKEIFFGLQLDFDDPRETRSLGNLLLPLKFSDFPKIYPTEPDLFNRNRIFRANLQNSFSLAIKLTS